MKKRIFRNGTNQYLQKDLFEETSSKPELVLYCLARENTEYPSLYRFYMSMEDFTEFEFASKYFESFQHWKEISNSAWFAPYIAEWREELELKIKARNLKSLIEKAEVDVSVAKFLLGKKWVDDAQIRNPGVNLRGRPSKEEIKGHLRLITMEERKIEEDIERMKKS
jgi:hypothetical protein